MTKSLVSGAAAILVAMSLTGCGAETKIESGTYTCSKEGIEETLQMVFDMEKHTYDMIVKGYSIQDSMKALGGSGIKMIMSIGDYNEKTEEYELKQGIQGMMSTLYLKRNGDEFWMREGEKPADKMTCIKEEK